MSHPAFGTQRPAKLLAEERKRKILELVERDGRVMIADLAREFGVSAVTVRADLDELTESGAVVRSHGGAVKRQEGAPDVPVQLKQTLHRAEKARIGRAAAQLVQPNQTIILDSGSTTLEVARALKAARTPSLTIITNALNIASELVDAPNVTVIMLGGILRPIALSCVGPQAEQMLRNLAADHLFLAADGFDPEAGPSTPDILEAQLNSLMMAVAREVTVVTDSSKFGRRSLTVIGPIAGVHRVITDAGVAAETVAALEQRGIAVVAV